MSKKINVSLENDEYLCPDNGNNCNQHKLSIEHEDLVQLTNKALKKILAADPLLKDIPIDENLNDEILAKVTFLLLFSYFMHDFMFFLFYFDI